MGAPRRLRRVGVCLALVSATGAAVASGEGPDPRFRDSRVPLEPGATLAELRSRPNIPLCTSADPPDIGGFYSFSDPSPHTFRARLEKGQSLEASFEENDLDIRIVVSGPSGFQDYVVDSPRSFAGREDVVVVASKPGCYELQVPVPDEGAGSGKFVPLSWKVGPATKRQRDWVKGGLAYSEGMTRAKQSRESRSAQGSFKSAAEAWRRAGFRRGEANALRKLGGLQKEKEPEAAAQAYSRAAELYVSERLYPQGVSSWLFAGRCEQARNRGDEAGEAFRRAVELARSIWPVGGGSPERQLPARVELGRLYLQGILYWVLNELAMGSPSYESMLESLAEALWISDQIDQPSYRRLALAGLAATYSLIGDVERSRSFEREAEGALEKGEESSIVAYLWNAQGDIYSQSGQSDRALAYYQRALKAYELNSDRRSQAVVHNQICRALLELSLESEALVECGKALSTWQGEDRNLEAKVRVNLGWAFSRLGRVPEARESLSRALTMSQRNASPEAQVGPRFALAVLERAMGNLREAQAQVERALQIVERASARLRDSRDRTAYRYKYRDLADLLVEVLLQRHVLEPGRDWAMEAWVLAETINSLGMREAVHLRGLRRAGSELSRISWKELERIREKLLGPDTVLLEYSLTKEAGYLFIADGSGLRAVALARAKEIPALASEFRSSLAESVSLEPQQRAASLARELSAVLLGPAEKELASKRRVLISVPSALETVPFSLLPDPAAAEPGIGAAWPTPLSERYEVISIPSLTWVKAKRSSEEVRTSPQRALAILDDPVTSVDDPRFGAAKPALESQAGDLAPVVLTASRLKNAPREVDAILKLFPLDQVFRASAFQANRQLLLSGKVAGFDIVHILSHALFSEGRREESALLLSLFDAEGQPVNGRVTAAEISDLRLNARLVVLSACSTGLGSEVWGEGLASLSQAFLKAGARSVLQSLWEVEDEATAELMARFYEGLLRQKLSPAEALRRAQASLRSDPRWSSPFYWGGFVLKGDWR